MRTLLTFRLVLLSILFVALIGAVAQHSAHLGAAEWIIVALLLVALATAMVREAQARPASRT